MHNLFCQNCFGKSFKHNFVGTHRSVHGRGLTIKNVIVVLRTDCATSLFHKYIIINVSYQSNFILTHCDLF